MLMQNYATDKIWHKLAFSKCSKFNFLVELE